jgi:ATP-dependent DNA helicase RecG
MSDSSPRAAAGPPLDDPLGALLRLAPHPRGLTKDSKALITKVAGGETARDLIFLAPTGAIDRRARVMIADAQDGAIVTIEAEVDAHVPAHSPKSPYKVRLRDETGFLTATYFRPNAEMLKRMWPVGQKRLVSGKVEVYSGERQMLHPDYVVDPERGEAPPAVEPVYPLTQGLPGRTLQRAIKAALGVLVDLPEWLDGPLLKAKGWPGFSEALRMLHQPETPEMILPDQPARSRLAFDELLARQAALRLRRAARRGRPGQALGGDGRFTNRLLERLPYQPTGAQARAFDEIGADMAAGAPMVRLLQGDVGAGKTLVAGWAMARAAEAGAQSVLMAPTELLARQHGRSILPLLEAAGVSAAVFTGRDKGQERAAILKGLKSGALSVAIGTHALFQDEVTFDRLGLVVIDEQHRFGVADRMRLVQKGADPHVLVMSATPIPRTLSLAVHGDMELTVLDEKPPGRQPIRTVAMPTDRIDELADSIASAAQRNERTYWVCPLIEESEMVDLAAVTDRFESLRERFGDAVEIMHGKMSPADRDAAMARFKAGEAFVMVATTVIEVGVDVPEATIMVIEHAERFGLAQLHQLRGRVGRGEKKGFCILLWQAPLSALAKERLDALRRTEDGFLIAELDYKMRGAGDLLGVRQSGMPPFRFVEGHAHGDLLTLADQEARRIIDADPGLTGPRGQALRPLLALFGADDASGLARSG